MSEAVAIAELVAGNGVFDPLTAKGVVKVYMLVVRPKVVANFPGLNDGEMLQCLDGLSSPAGLAKADVCICPADIFPVTGEVPDTDIDQGFFVPDVGGSPNMGDIHVLSSLNLRGNVTKSTFDHMEADTALDHVGSKIIEEA